MKRNMIVLLTLLLMLTIPTAMANTPEHSIPVESELLAAHFDAEDRCFQTVEQTAWGTTLEDFLAAQPEEWVKAEDVLEMPNGHRSVTPEVSYTFQTYDRDFTTTYVFSEEGLYVYNLRAIVPLTEAADAKALLADLTERMIAEHGEPDYTNETFVSDFSKAEMSDILTEGAWFSEGTFLSIQAVSFNGNVLIDVNTGLVSAFEKYTQA